MNRSKHHRQSKARSNRRAWPRPDTPAETQSANLSSPFFRGVWSASSKMSWQSFVDRWERRFHSPPDPRARRR